MWYLTGNLLALILAIGVLCLTGRIVVRALRLEAAERSLGIAFWFAVGAATWMGVTFALGALQALSLGAVAIPALLLVLVGWRLRGEGPIGPAPGLAGGSTEWPAVVLALALGALAVLLWLQNQWPMVAWDANAYHLTIPRLYLESGGFRRIDFNVYSNWPLNTQMLYLLALMTRGYVLAKMIHFLFGVMTLLLVYRVVARTARPWAGWVGGALFLLNPVVLDEMRAAYVDLAYGFFLLVAFLLMHQALEGGRANLRGLILAGVMSGVAAGIKPTGLVGALGVALVYLTATLRRRDPLASVSGGFLRLVLPAGLLLLPWAVKSWILTGESGLSVSPPVLRRQRMEPRARYQAP